MARAHPMPIIARAPAARKRPVLAILAAALALVLAVPCPPVFAQSAATKAKEKPATKQSSKPETKTAPAPLPEPLPASPQQSAEPPPPYEAQLLRLAQIMGTLAYLRDLCGAGDGDAWRSKMANLLDSETKSGPRRQTLAGAYNKGFHGYETTYHTCTSHAAIVMQRFLSEGNDLARDIANRFRGS